MGLFDKEKRVEIQKKIKDLKKNSIMIIDDDEDHLRSMVSLLSDEYHIITASDGQEALGMIKKMENPESINVIISDQRMPRLTGIEFFEKLLPILPNTIRIILTGYVDIPLLIDSVNKTRVYKFIPKPFEPEEFKFIVKRAIEEFENQTKNEEYCRTLEEQYKKLKQKNKELQDAKRKLEESITISTSIPDKNSI